MTDDLPSPDVPAMPGPSAPPAESTIEVLEENSDRLVLFIPAGAKRGRELGCFGLLWTTVISIITAAMVNGFRQANGPDAKALLFLVPFWLVGLLMLYFALRMRHTRTLVLVERSRAVLQTTFFGRTKTRETNLLPGEPATLVEAYRQNEVPVDSVCVKGDPRPLKFGTALENNEKAWIVDRINGFLGVNLRGDAEGTVTGPTPTRVLPEKCSSCGSSLGTQPEGAQEATCPFCGAITKAEITFVQTGPSDFEKAVGEFPSERVTVVEQSPDRLEFGMKVLDSGKMRRGGALALGIFALFWNGIVGVFVWAILFESKFNVGSLFMLVFLLPFIAVGLAIAGAAVFILAGRLRVRLDRDRLQAAWGVGPLRYSRYFLTEAITHVTVENSPMAAKTQRPRTQAEDTRMAIVWSEARWIPITMLQGVNDCRHVAEMVRRELSDMGFHVADRRTPVVMTDILDDDDDEDDDEDEEDQEDELDASRQEESRDSSTNDPLS